MTLEQSSVVFFFVINEVSEIELHLWLKSCLLEYHCKVWLIFCTNVTLKIKSHPCNRPWRLIVCDTLKLLHCLSSWLIDVG
jgi:hypothetical protein